MTGLMRVKNEARWIARCVKSILPVCDRVLVMDDHSTDGTPDICAAIPGVEVFASYFAGLDETRDKNWLLEKTSGDEWVLMIDGDEILSHDSIPLIEIAMTTAASCFALQVLYLWDSENQIRVDGIYGRFWRPSMFRSGLARFQAGAPCGFHCGNAPGELRRYSRLLDGARLLHLGYLYREDRIRKFDWYTRQDPDNKLEDGYRHMVIGDTFPADSAFLHAGPLKLTTFSV